MKYKISNDKVKIEEGIYSAIWKGYTLDILSNLETSSIDDENIDRKKLVTIRTINVVRCRDYPIEVEVIGNYVYKNI